MESQERFLHSRVSFFSDYDHSAYWLVYDSLIPRFDFGSIFFAYFSMAIYGRGSGNPLFPYFG